MADIPKTPDAPIMRFDHLEVLEGLIWRSEGARLAHLASLVPSDQVIVELGSYKGKSTAFLASGAKAGDGAKVHAVDLWDLGGQGSPGTAKWGFDRSETFAAFESQLRSAKVWSQVVAHRGDTVQVGRDWTGPPVGLLFVDGWHTAAQIGAEVDAWAPHLVPGGTIAFHDYGDSRYEVTRFVDGWLDGRPATRYKRIVSVRL